MKIESNENIDRNQNEVKENDFTNVFFYPSNSLNNLAISSVFEKITNHKFYLFGVTLNSLNNKPLESVISTSLEDNDFNKILLLMENCDLIIIELEYLKSEETYKIVSQFENFNYSTPKKIILITNP